MKRFAAAVSPLFLLACEQGADTPDPDVAERPAEVMDLAFAASTDDGVAFVFAAPAQGAAVLTADDRYTAQMQAREARIRAQDASVTQFDGVKPLYAADVQEWTTEEMEALKAAITGVMDKLDGIDALLPEEVLLVKTGTVVEGGLPHTRANAIIFAGGTIPEGDSLQGLFLHELHHVLSRANRELHDEYFALIGFLPCRFEEPASLRETRLSNPDAPTYDHYVPAEVEGADGVTPYLFASRDYDGEGRLPAYFGFGLLPLEVENGVCTAAVETTDALLAPDAVPAYLQALGGNTNYIIHPEETLADNFVHWAMGREDVTTPSLVEAVGTFWLEKAGR